ncbi:hypothetical protein AAMO2058_001379800 [Amorphochlora amoebiformis]
MASTRVAVIGGGIAGLSAAYHLRVALPHAKVVIFEASDRTGGWIRTEKRGNFLFECGPATLRGYPAGEDTWDLIRDIGIEHQILKPTNSMTKRFIFSGGRLKQIGLFGLIKTYPEIMLEPLKPTGPPDETVGCFLKRRFGEKFCLEMGDSMVNGIYAGGINTISVRSSSPFSKLKNMEMEYGSVTRAAFTIAVSRALSSLRSLLTSLFTSPLNSKNKPNKQNATQPPRYAYTFRYGLETLPSALTQHIIHPNPDDNRQPVCLKTRHSMRKIKFLASEDSVDSGGSVGSEGMGSVDSGGSVGSEGVDSGGSVGSEGTGSKIGIVYAKEGGEEVYEEFDAAVGTLSANEIGEALDIETTNRRVREALFDANHMASCTLIGVGWERKSGKLSEDSGRFSENSEESSENTNVDLPRGFGHLIPGTEGENALGIIWHSSIFPDFGEGGSEQARFTIVMGGESVELPEHKLRTMAREALYKQLKVLAPADSRFNISRTHHSISHYKVGHAERLRMIRENLPRNFQLAGAAFDGVSVHDCLSSGKRAAQAIASNL